MKCVRVSDQVTKHGRMHGYPECCIRQFASELEKEQAVERGVKVITGAGDGFISVYVPCDACRELDEVDRNYHTWEEWSVIVTAIGMALA